jgi:hypothetical protein
MYKITTILIVIIILFGYIYLSTPDKVVINEKGQVKGLINKGRAFLQGGKFWELQLKMADDRYHKLLLPQVPSSLEMQKLYNKLAEDERVLNEKMKPLYSTEEQMANSFRMKADSLDRAGKWRTIDEAAIKATTEESEKYKIIIPIIESKLKSIKPLDIKPLDTKPKETKPVEKPTL